MHYICIMTNQHNTVLDTGVPNDLLRRVCEHRAGLGGGFTSRYRVGQLACYETTNDVQAAIARETQIKAGSRRRKLELVARMNLAWRDLSEEL